MTGLTEEDAMMLGLSKERTDAMLKAREGKP